MLEFEGSFLLYDDDINVEELYTLNIDTTSFVL